MLFWGWFWLGVFSADSGHICCRWATLWCRNLLLSSDNFTPCHLVKIQWLVVDVTAVGSVDRAERAILRVIVAWRAFGQPRWFLWSGSLFVVYVGTSSWALITLLRVTCVCSPNRVVGYRCNSCRIPWQSASCYFGGDFGWAIFWPIQDTFVIAEPLSDGGSSSWALVTLLRVI